VLSVVGKSSTETMLTSFTYTYTNGSNDTPLVQTQTENDAVASNTYTYSYNAANELTAAAVTSGTGTSYSYTYDADGNMMSKTAGSATTAYAYNSADQLCWAYAGASSNPCSSAPTGATTYSFDSDGNQTGSSAGVSFSYDTKDQTTSTTYGGTTLSGLSYTDQGQDNRTSVGSTTFDNSTSGTAISTTAGSSTYYLTNGQGTVLGERTGSAHYYFLTNALGSVVAVINGTGQTVADRYGYDPYGNTTYSSVTVANPFGYAGGYTDPTGLVRFGARYYDPTTARWTQVDPEASGSTSAYDYSGDNPTNETDPSGLQPAFLWGTSFGSGWFFWGLTATAGTILAITFAMQWLSPGPVAFSQAVMDTFGSDVRGTDPVFRSTFSVLGNIGVRTGSGFHPRVRLNVVYEIEVPVSVNDMLIEVWEATGYLQW
jgi:RHS repeat-associated protein